MDDLSRAADGEAGPFFHGRAVEVLLGMLCALWVSFAHVMTEGQLV